MAFTPLDASINLPYLPQLGINEPITLTQEDVRKIAVDFIQRFSDAIAASNVDYVLSLFIPESLWRDFLALTWEFNTIFKIENIRKMLEARLAKSQISNIRLAEHRDLSPASFNPPPPAPLLLINVPFEFDTVTGNCIGIAKLVPVSSPNGLQWKIFTLFTNLDQIKGFPDKIGPNRKKSPILNYTRQRQKEVSFEDEDPRVIIIGGGHSGLAVAARLKVKDVKCLVFEKNARIGDTWRDRYTSLTLFDPSWMASSPYLPFPANWPRQTPASKYADWLEMYAKVMDLNVWTSTTVTHVERDDVRAEWVVHVIKPDGTLRIFRPTYVVACVGFGEPYTPDIPGMDKFHGSLMHAYSYKGPEEHVGKKVVVIGTAAAGHDICQDHYEYGVDVTMVQRSSTCVMRSPQGMSIYTGRGAADNDIPIDIKDRLGASFPLLILKKIHQHVMKDVIQAEKPFYDALENAGFQLNHGPDGAGPVYLGIKRQGGFYIDFGASQQIIDKKVKLKPGNIKEFTSTGMIFEDGTSLDADIVIFATGVKGFQNYLYKLLKPELADKIPVFHLSNEGEFEGVYRECGLPNFFPVMGNLAMSRFYSSHVSLIIKAKEEGLYTDAYKHTEGHYGV